MISSTISIGRMSKMEAFFERVGPAKGLRLDSDPTLILRLSDLRAFITCAVIGSGLTRLSEK